MSLFDQVVKILGGNGSTAASVALRGSKGALGIEILDASGNQVIPGAALVTAAYDYIALTYVVGGNGVGEVETATFKSGGASGTTVATLTLTYDASNRVSSVTKS